MSPRKQKLVKILDTTVEVSEPVKLVLDMDLDDDVAPSSLRMTYPVAEVSIKGEPAGHIAQCLGVGVQVRVGRRTWFISAEALWTLAVAANRTYEAP